MASDKRTAGAPRARNVKYWEARCSIGESYLTSFMQLISYVANYIPFREAEKGKNNKSSFTSLTDFTPMMFRKGFPFREAELVFAIYFIVYDYERPLQGSSSSYATVPPPFGKEREAGALK
ncbi:hypothetical protein H6P81_006117 [Aristolochia fimbriata]|uniref:Uncharacterized protein n=1 Tax=Aristolochia fimbriata TaxID=158543 RepID=A0AAV7F104_ARIFI|nr:hypothetical protein H6P81_006117 [Aristolochia fimbriata]